MGENSKIEWTDHTFNAWTGCAKVGPGCDHCYAETWAKRSGLVGWGPQADRRLTSAANWKKPLKWDREAEAAGERHRVFVNSLSDTFDNRAPQEWRDRLWALIKRCRNLDWIIVTKRIGNAPAMLPEDWEYDYGNVYRNVWLLATVCTQEEANRDIPKLLKVSAAVRGLSIEPMLEPVDIANIPVPGFMYGRGVWDTLEGKIGVREDGPGSGWLSTTYKPLGWEEGMLLGTTDPRPAPRLDWVIAGGESTTKARPMSPEWPRTLLHQCKVAGVRFFMKQMSGRAPIPDDLMVREFPR